jgi:lipopolysaccharide/colanic/teichoic acid biosynthesis glycosyltransferase
MSNTASNVSARPYSGKGALDLLALSAACLALAPLAAGIALATWAEDGGPPFFLQTRLGRDRRPFTVVKFRSMSQERVTRVGTLLRRTGLDELPQFINVARGEMSLVGPRPLTRQDVARLGWDTSGYDWRFAAKPGITGLSQLLAGRGARFSRRLDRLYLKRQSLTLDVSLIAFSFAANVLGKRRIRKWLRRVSAAQPREPWPL